MQEALALTLLALPQQAQQAQRAQQAPVQAIAPASEPAQSPPMSPMSPVSQDRGDDERLRDAPLDRQERRHASPRTQPHSATLFCMSTILIVSKRTAWPHGSFLCLSGETPAAGPQRRGGLVLPQGDGRAPQTARLHHVISLSSDPCSLLKFTRRIPFWSIQPVSPFNLPICIYRLSSCLEVP